MDDPGEGSQATRRQVLGATAGALAVGALPGRSSAQQASGPTVYVGSGSFGGDTLYAVDAATGTEEWAFTQPSGDVYSSPTVADGTVYVGSDDETLYAVDAETGEEEWAFTQPSGDVYSSPTVVADPESGDSVGSRVLLGTLGHHGNRGGQETNPTSANFEVSIESVTEASAGETLDVTATVENTGEASTTQTVELSSPSLGSDSTTVSLECGDSTTETLSLSTGEGDAGEYTATVESEDDSAQQEVMVLAPATFTVDIVETSDPVEGGSLDVTIAIENIGDMGGTRTVALGVPGLGSDSVERSLDGGESTTETLSILTETGDAGEYDATVNAGDSSDSASVTILEPAAFTVDITEVNNPVAGESVEVTVAVENTGDKPANQTIALTVPSLGSDSVELGLDSGKSTIETLWILTETGDAGEYDATVNAGDSSDSASVTVLEPAAFTVDITDVNNPVAGESVEVTVAVENMGDESSSQMVELSISEFGSDSTTVSLNGGESTTLTLSVPTSNADAGEYTATVSSSDDMDDESVTVADAPSPGNGLDDDTNGDSGGEPPNSTDEEEEEEIPFLPLSQEQRDILTILGALGEVGGIITIYNHYFRDNDFRDNE